MADCQTFERVTSSARTAKEKFGTDDSKRANGRRKEFVLNEWLQKVQRLNAGDPGVLIKDVFCSSFVCTTFRCGQK